MQPTQQETSKALRLRPYDTDRIRKRLQPEYSAMVAAKYLLRTRENLCVPLGMEPMGFDDAMARKTPVYEAVLKVFDWLVSPSVDAALDDAIEPLMVLINQSPFPTDRRGTFSLDGRLGPMMNAVGARWDLTITAQHTRKSAIPVVALLDLAGVDQLEWLEFIAHEQAHHTGVALGYTHDHCEWVYKPTAARLLVAAGVPWASGLAVSR